jgi:hypothetical protein
MNMFDLLFLASALITALTMIAVLIVVVRRQWRTAMHIVVAWVIFAVMYLAVSFAISYIRPQRVLAIGDSWCFDDWCLNVNNVNVRPAASRNTYEVQFRMFSRAGRVTQRAKGAWMYLVDDRGQLYLPQPDASQEPLDVVLGPNESVATRRVFQVPTDVHSLGLITGHGSGYCGTMSVLVIGDGGCWFHKPPMIQIK